MSQLPGGLRPFFNVFREGLPFEINQPTNDAESFLPMEVHWASLGMPKGGVLQCFERCLFNRVSFTMFWCFESVGFEVAEYKVKPNDHHATNKPCPAVFFADCQGSNLGVRLVNQPLGSRRSQNRCVLF